MIDWSQQQVKMLFNILLISMCCAAAYGHAYQQLAILSPTPESLQFAKTTDSPLKSASVGDVFAASIGYPVTSDDDWTGLRISNPFETPHVAVAVVLDELPTDSAPLSEITFKLDGAGGRASLVALEERIPNYQQLELFAVEEQKDAKRTYASLKPETNAGHREFVAQVSSLKALSERVSVTEGPAFVQVSLPIGSLLGGSSELAKREAAALLKDALQTVSEELRKQFGDVLLAVVTVTAEEQSRQKRQAPVTDETNNWNLADDYNEDYPVVFNIILWFGVIFVFSLLAISYAIGNMDPGRDSIIYRMTSTRMKKDN